MRTPSGAALEPVTATSTPPRPTATRRASGGRSRQRRPARRGVHHHEVLPGRQDPAAEAERASAGSASTRSTSTSSTGPGRSHLGVAGDGSGRERDAPLDRGLELQRRRARAAARGRDHRRRRQSGPVQPVRVPAGAARGVRGPTSRRGLQPARDGPAPFRSDRRACRRARRPHARAGPAALVPSARDDRLPKSTHRERIEENAQIFDFTLSDDDMADLDALDTTGGTDSAANASGGDPHLYLRRHVFEQEIRFTRPKAR